VQVPPPAIDTVAPVFVHTVDGPALKLTGNCEVADALTVNGDDPNATLDNAPKLIVWLSGVTVKL
jgi:hypothetical protein